MYAIFESYSDEATVAIAKDFNARIAEIAEKRAVIDEKRREFAGKGADILNLNVDAHRAAGRDLAQQEICLNRAELRVLLELREKFPPLVEAERATYLKRCIEAHDSLLTHIQEKLESLDFPRVAPPGLPGGAYLESGRLARSNPSVRSAKLRMDEAKIKAEHSYDVYPLQRRIESLESALKASVAAA
jgi:hypothetical protein